MRSAHKRRNRVLIGVAALLAVLAVAVDIYVGDYYHALPYAVPAIADGSAIPIGEYDGFTIYGNSTHGIVVAVEQAMPR